MSDTINFVAVRSDSCEFGSAKYIGLCTFGGALSCGLTHTAVVPLDLVKCRIQVSSYMNKSSMAHIIFTYTAAILCDCAIQCFML